jgi:hypothetical protein
MLSDLKRDGIEEVESKFLDGGANIKFIFFCRKKKVNVDY